MKSSVVGKSASRAEITNISVHGIWLLFKGKEYFLPFSEYPWFKSARISEIQNVKLVHHSHLFWPDLDVDLSKEILENLESYPLISK